MLKIPNFTSSTLHDIVTRHILLAHKKAIYNLYLFRPERIHKQDKNYLPNSSKYYSN